MIRVTPPAAVPVASAARRRITGGFALPASPDVTTPCALNGPSLLGLQELPDPYAGGLEAGVAVLDALRDVQAALLAGQPAPALDQRLARLPDAADPALASLITAIRIRAQVTGAVLAKGGAAQLWHDHRQSTG